MDFFEPQTLIVVYKDELHVNQLKKLVETKDDREVENVVGTTDGSVKIVAWTEKVWLAQKKAGNVENKVLFLGRIKGADKLIPLVDIAFDEYGVKYGWAGNQAVLWVEPSELKDEKVYEEFLRAFRCLPVPKTLKSGMETSLTVRAQSTNFWDQIAAGVTNVAISVKDFVTNNKHLREQMLFYGIINMYIKDLEGFLQA